MVSHVDWESRYQAGDMPWDKGEASPPLRDFLRNRSWRGRVLVPGCGTGHDVRLLGEHGMIVTGLDLAASAIALARQATPRGATIHWEQRDFLALPDEWNNTFDGLVEHTCFCAIPPQLRPAYAKAAAAMVKPSGFLLAIFYLDPDCEDGPPYGCTKEELNGLFDPAWRLVEELIPTVGYEGRVRKELLRFYQRVDDDPAPESLFV
jgi:methyl halide transferase